MIKFSKKEMNKSSNIIRTSIKNNKGLPSSVTMTDMAGKKHKLDKAYYNGLFEAQNVFIRKHGRYPNYVTLNSKSNNPLVMDYQDTSTTCGPTSLSMAIQMLYSNTSESDCVKVCKTGSSGTSPENLITGAKSLGYKLTRIVRISSAVKNNLRLGKPVIAHIETGGKTKPSCLGYVNNYGHYILIYGVSGDSYLVADPTKGLKRCKFSQIDNATNGRSINYYSVTPI